jgi:predicted DNA-binding transcriptional regulator YafY
VPKKEKPLWRRLLAIDRALRRGGRVTCGTILELPECEGYTRKTVLRDVEYLRDTLHAPIEYDPRLKGYRYTRGDFFLKAVPLDEGDLFAVMIAEKVLDQYRGTPLFARLEETFERIRGYLPERVRVSREALEGRLAFFFPPAARFRPEVWDAVAAGISRDRTLRIEHTTPGQEKPFARDVDPYFAVSHAGAWYLIGYCHHKKDIRTFAFSRISAARALDATFEMPADFDLDAYLGPRFGIMRGEREHTVRLRFSQVLAPFVLERDWHPTQSLAKRRDGSVDLSFRVNDLFEVRRWALSWGPGAEVLAPRELREAVRAEAAGTARTNRRR